MECEFSMVTMNEVLGKKNVQNVIDDLYKNESNKKNYLEFRTYYENNKEFIHNRIRNNKYELDVVRLKDIVNYKGKRRTISIMSIQDKFVSKLLLRILDKYISPGFSDNSFAYQKGKGTLKALQKIKEYVNDGNVYVGKIDIKDYFENINHSILMSKLRKYQIEDNVLFLINKFIQCRVEDNFITREKTNGILQGCPLSSLLCNIYLDDFDKFVYNSGIHYIRYCDDIYIFDKSYEIVQKSIQIIIKNLFDDYLLSVNKNKVEIVNVYFTTYFGYKLIKKDNQIEIVKVTKEFPYSNKWKKTSLAKINNEYHIINDGILTLSDYTILFENKNKKIHIPAVVVQVLNVYSNIIINSNFFSLINHKNIIVNFYDKHNRYIGKFIPDSVKKSSLVLLKQVSVYNDEKKRLNLAKDIFKAEVYNLKSNLKYYHRRKGYIDSKIKLIEDYENSIHNIYEHHKLLLLEARIKGIYYSCFNEILENDDFKFIKRTKRPPKDSLNALISFANTLLYNFIATEIYKTTLDIRIAYLHSSNHRYESLNLDLVDIFKPVIVDKMIFTLINRKMIHRYKHFEVIGNGTYLNNDGKYIVIDMFYKRIRTITTYGNKKISYAEIIRKDIYKLIYSICENRSFKAYKYY